MRLRKLELKDAPLMLEWMHDKNVTGNLRTNFSEKTLDDVELFIRTSWERTNDDLHLAIVSDEDIYMGTVSLKYIGEGSAEFAITVRSASMGHGYSWFGMKEILKKAFEEIKLESVYWCVSRQNVRAVRFYDKHNFNEVLDVPDSVLERYRGVENLKWYSILKGDEINVRETVAGCKVVHIKTIPTVNAGELSFFEAMHEVPFDIKRIYYISKVPEGVRRGFHAHKELKQLIFCPYGRIQLVLENSNGREEIELSDPSIGVVIEECTWREMLWLQKDSVLCVAASDFYKTEDYIRNYDEFAQYIKSAYKNKV
ncbi:MAG: GNAT family N-acetyltransferase [Dorea sp.]|nr:GNAT family N-acetyltransferase [Dorea sp.]